MLLTGIANAASGSKSAAQASQMLLPGVANAAAGNKSAAQASHKLLLVVITIRNHWSRSLVLVTLHSLTLYLVALHSVHVYAQVHISIYIYIYIYNICTFKEASLSTAAPGAWDMGRYIPVMAPALGSWST